MRCFRLREQLIANLLQITQLLMLAIFLTACNSTPQAPLPPPTPTFLLTAPAIPLDLTALRTYTHRPSQNFTISYPAAWQVFEYPDSVIFIDPTNQAGYSVFIAHSGLALSAAELEAVALEFVHANFGAEADFAISNAPLSQTETTIQFKGTDANLGAAVNELIVYQTEEIVYFTLISSVEAQWPDIAPPMRHLVSTLLPQDSVRAPQAEAPVEPPTWILYAHPNARFGFLYPDDWQLTESTQSVTVALPAAQMSLTIRAISATNEEAMMLDAENYLLNQLEQRAKAFDTLEALAIQPYQTDGGAGHTVDYLYTNAAGLAMAEAMIVTQIDSQRYQIIISAPALTYEEALAWFNPMLQSFQVLPEE